MNPNPSNDPITIQHTASGAKATIYPYGATISSFLTSTGRELLFVSSQAHTDGSKPIRGGIPLVFPQFGQQLDKNMPQHGFLRANYWTIHHEFMVDSEMEASCICSLPLSQVVNNRGGGDGDGPWSKTERDCIVQLQVKVTSQSLATILTIRNTGSDSFPYQTLFHTYYKINGSEALNPQLCNVSGLKGYECFNQLTSVSSIVGEEEDGEKKDDSIITVQGELDSIYTPPPSTFDLNVRLCTGKESPDVTIHAHAQDSKGQSLPVCVVVWNPHVVKAGKMADFGNEEYHDMICVEPGLLDRSNSEKKQILNAGDHVTFTQVIKSEE